MANMPTMNDQASRSGEIPMRLVVDFEIVATNGEHSIVVASNVGDHTAHPD